MDKYIVVVGGTNMDVSATSYGTIKMEDSNPGRVVLQPGGVGRNIAENLCRLGKQTSLITALAQDLYARNIMEDCKSFGLDLSRSAVLEDETTGLYLCINDSTGDMLVAVSSMDICQRIDAALIEQNLDFLNGASLVIIDANLPEATIRYIAENVRAPLACDLVSIAKCTKIKPILGKLTLVKANRFEAETITRTKIDKLSDLEKTAAKILETGCKNIIVTLGDLGAYYCNAEKKGRIPSIPCTVMNTTGCGDAFMAAACACYMENPDLEEMTKYGVVASSVTASHNGPVMPFLTVDMIERQMKIIR